MHKNLYGKGAAFSTAMVALALAVSGLTLRAQGPLYDRVTVNLPYAVNLGDKTLQPGDYTIEELPSAAKTNILLVYSDNGMRFEIAAQTIPTLDKKVPERTDVILHHFGQDYYFDKIWVQGKDYGYEFPLPNNVKGREKERMEPVDIGATYHQTPPEPPTTAQNTQPGPEPAPAPAATTTTTEEPAAAPVPEPAPTAQATTPEPAPAPEVAQSTNNDEQNTADREMPKTAANWLMMLLSGGALSGAGMILRRKG